MKISDVTINANAHEQGEWVSDIPEMGDLRLKVRGIGNADWRRLGAKLNAAVPREKKRGGIVAPEAQDDIVTACLLDACLLGWDGLTDAAEAPIAFSRAKAEELLKDPMLRRFRDAVVWAASMVGDAVAADKDTSAGN